MGSISLVVDAENAKSTNRVMTEDNPEEDRKLDSEMKLVSLAVIPHLDTTVVDCPHLEAALADSPHLDANVSHRQSGGEGTQQTKFTRSWSFMESAEKRKVTLADVKGKKVSNLKVDLRTALARSWSFTKTIQSPGPEDPHSNFMEFIAIDDKHTAQQLEELQRPKSPMSGVPDKQEPKADSGNPLTAPVVEQEVKKEFKVKPLLRTVVVPSEPTEKHWLPISNLDRVVNPVFSSVIHYYKGVISETRSFTDVTKFLKDTLAKTLVDFYPLAGRLALGKDGKVDLHCNDAGAVWIEAAVASDLEDVGGPQPNHLLSGLNTARLGPGPIYIPDQITPMPVLIIQTTKFTCGAIAVATSWHHTVADGFSGTHFMRSWAEVAQGKPISIKPIHSRIILRPRDPPSPTLVNGYSTQSLDEFPGKSNVSTAAPPQLEKFDLGKEAITQLKMKANLEPPPFTPRPYSSAESISAHLWKQMTKARAEANSYEDDIAKGQQTKFFMFVDGRKRLRLPPGYFGNVVCSACAVAKEADILDKPLHYAASLIRTATRNITEEYFRSLIDWVELQGMSSSKSEHVNSLGHDVAATFWTLFPMYEIEFGWGRPVFAGRNSPPRPLIDGIAMMPSAEGQGGMVALLNLHSDRMSKLQRQISFVTVFHS